MKIFLCGQTFRGEFQGVVADVDNIALDYDVTVETRKSIADVENDPNYPRFLRDVDFFVLCRSFPNEFRARDVEALRRAAPLAPIALIAGTLCEGENRTGESFPGVRRFYFDSWRNVGRVEFARFFEQDGAKGIFAAAPTTNNVDLLVGENARLGLTSNSSARVLILSNDSAMRALLMGAFEEKGGETQVEPLDYALEPSAPNRIIVDAPDLSSVNFSETLERLLKLRPNARFDVLAFAPRFDEIETLESRGNVRVVAKPFNLECLTEI